MRRPLLTLIMLLCASATCSASLSADDVLRGYYGYGFPWFGHGNNGPAAYALGNIPTPPYFALHPPVYYSGPVPRPYGHSPFAFPGFAMMAGPRVETRILVNPHMTKKPAPAAANASVAATPVRIANPFFTDEANQPELASN